MRKEDINIRDPFIVYEDGVYYMYGTRAVGLGYKVGGFDVYTSKDLKEWSDPIECFDSEKHGLNREVNWAPEVHKYKGKYYLFATFTQENGLRGTYSLRSDELLAVFQHTLCAHRGTFHVPAPRILLRTSPYIIVLFQTVKGWEVS